jgi:capsular exopolysaccharide synthesis family protein
MKPEFSRGLEEFRMLRSRLLRERTQRYLKTILVSGATPGEGKTFVTANLALAMSRNPGSRVLVVDADLRRSSLHTVFGMEPVPGLSGYLGGKMEPEAIVRQTPDPQLCVVTSGKYSDTPTELLHSRRMQAFIESMSQAFDWIFIDSPPAAAVADSVVLSEICDGVVLVIAPGTPIAAAQKCRKEMGQKILGVVLNRVEDSSTDYGYYEYKEKAGKKRAAKLRSRERSQ